MSDPLDDDRFHRWLAAAASDTLDAEAQQQLFAHLAADPAARGIYIDYMLAHAGLRWEFPGSAGVGRTVAVRVLRRSWWRRPAAWLAAAAVILVLVGVGWRAAATPAAAARVVALADAAWEGGDAAVGDALAVGRSVRLERGLVRLRFAAGAQVVVQAPAAWTVLNGNACRLDEGRLVAHAAAGFLVSVRGCDVLDQGTEFAVAADDTGTEVHVFAGAVQVGGAVAGQRLTTAEALRIDAGGTTRRMPARPEGFVRVLPDDGSPLLEPVPLPLAPVVTVLAPAVSDPNQPGGLPARQILDRALRHVFITDAIDDWHYLTGQTPSGGSGGNWSDNDGVRLWRSRDLRTWENLGLVWSLDRDATWARERRASFLTHISPDGERWRGVWGPELHRIRNDWYIVYSMSYGGTGILKSRSGRPEGPYTDLKPDGPYSDNIMPTLFADGDGAVFLLWSDRSIARLTDDLSALAEEPQRLEVPGLGWSEGPQLRRIGDRYCFTAGTFTVRQGHEARYDTGIAWGSSPRGPFTGLRVLLPYGGHGRPFQDSGGGWWATAFTLPGMEHRPALIPLRVGDDGDFRIRRPDAPALWRWITIDPGSAWTEPAFDDRLWDTRDLPAERSGPCWWRRTIHIPADRPLRLPRLHGRLTAPAEILLDGVVMAQVATAMTEPEALLLADAARLTPGRHVLAVRSAAQPLDLGLIDLLEPERVWQGIALHGRWRTGRGRTAASDDPLAVAAWRFTGSAVRLVHRTGPDGGIAMVLVDGRTAATVDTWSAGAEDRRVTPIAAALPAGPHLVQVLVTGRAAPKAKGALVQIVSFESDP